MSQERPSATQAAQLRANLSSATAVDPKKPTVYWSLDRAGWVDGATTTATTTAIPAHRAATSGAVRTVASQ